MDSQEFVSKYLPLFRRNWLPLSLGILGMIFFAYGLIGLFSANKLGSQNIVFEANSTVNNKTETKTMSVDIEGAVVKPGVYQLSQDSRIQDAFIAAGGLSAQADRSYVAKNINLAIKLTDGAKVYVPNLGEAVSQISVPNSSAQGMTVSALININTASESELDSLPGIGPVTAQKIIAGRQYNSISELKDKKVVSAKVFDQIKDKISTY
jgi:competence protein ComEA